MKKVVLSMAALSMLFFVACQGPKKEIARFLQFQNDSIAQVNTRLASDIEEYVAEWVRRDRSKSFSDYENRGCFESS